MTTNIQKWGNSLAVRIPKSVASEFEMEQGSTVEIKSSHGKLVITPVNKKRFKLKELLSLVTKKNRHGEIIFEPVGKEIW